MDTGAHARARTKRTPRGPGFATRRLVLLLMLCGFRGSSGGDGDGVLLGRRGAGAGSHDFFAVHLKDLFPSY